MEYIVVWSQCEQKMAFFSMVSSVLYIVLNYLVWIRFAFTCSQYGSAVSFSIEKYSKSTASKGGQLFISKLCRVYFVISS
jgi:hypothetical protein